MSWIDAIPADMTLVGSWVGASVGASIAAMKVGQFYLTSGRLSRAWRARQLRTIWGIKDGDKIHIVCSDLSGDEDDAAKRQYPEDRQFIYLAKYGDVDALFEVMTTLIVLFPNSVIRLVSSHEEEKSPSSEDHHLVIIGGPDYNEMTANEMRSERARVRYVDPHSYGIVEPTAESALFDPIEQRRYWYPRSKNYPNFDKDYGYFERYPSEGNDKYNVILIGGPNTVGVTGAAKAVAAFRMGEVESAGSVRLNAKLVRRKLGFCRRIGKMRTRRLLIITSVTKENSKVQVPLLEVAGIISVE